MFTGIVSAVGYVAEASSNHLVIEDAGTARRLKPGASVAVNGCCLTVVERRAGRFHVDVVPETLERTNLGLLRVGSGVNLELPLAADGLLDGHIVQGHVDATARVTRVTEVAAGRELRVELPSTIRSLVAEKGSIAVDGMSLTVAGVTAKTFDVALIPHTLAVTIARAYVQGSIVNLEADVIARYVARNIRG